MKLLNEFDTFLANTVNLNATRIKTLESRVSAIERFVEGSDYEPEVVRFSAQGSWAHKTIIKPSSTAKEFDADLVVYVRPVRGWSAADYVRDLRRVFRASPTYQDKTSTKSRCVTIDYANDFHLDVVPIVDRGGSYDVCNRTDDAFERTDGDGFADWWADKSETAGEEHLIETARLLKYLRDIKTTFSAKSVLLTTLIGNQVHLIDSVVDLGYFEDTPTALKTVLRRLDEWLDDRPTLPDVENPALCGESFTRHWDDEKYENFRTKMKTYREWVDEAYDEENRTESIRKWRRVFGSDFAKGETLAQNNAAVGNLANELGVIDLVEAVMRRGASVLARLPSVFPHVAVPDYRLGHNRLTVRIKAYERRRKGGENVRALQSGDLIIKHSGIRFEACRGDGLPFPDRSYLVTWQIVNTGDEAGHAGCLRGEFTAANRDHSHWEQTEYRGAHWVQAFLIGRRSGKIEGKSERFFVVIE